MHFSVKCNLGTQGDLYIAWIVCLCLSVLQLVSSFCVLTSLCRCSPFGLNAWLLFTEREDTFRPSHSFPFSVTGDKESSSSPSPSLLLLSSLTSHRCNYPVKRLSFSQGSSLLHHFSDPRLVLFFTITLSPSCFFSCFFSSCSSYFVSMHLHLCQLVSRCALKCGAKRQ